MKFLKIQDDKSVRIDNIEALETIDQLHTRIYMQNGNVYEALFPYDVLISILQIEEEKPMQVNTQELLQNLNAVAKTAGNFAG